MNWLIFMAYVAIGMTVEFLTTKNPTPGTRIGPTIGVFISGLFWGYLLPIDGTPIWIVGFGVAGVSRLCGFHAGGLIDKFRVARALRGIGYGRSTKTTWRDSART